MLISLSIKIENEEIPPYPAKGFEHARKGLEKRFYNQSEAETERIDAYG